jgi:tetratricopeptide (TPR) repeat protein
MNTLARPQRLLIVSALLFAAVAVMRFGPALFQPEAPTQRDTIPAVRSDSDGTDAQALRAKFGASDTAALISRLQTHLKANPEDAASYSQLGWAFIQRLRETGDASLYAQSDAAFTEALKKDPEQLDALLGNGTLALSRHDFAGALQYAERAQKINPFRAQVYGIQTDALIELGRYDAAIAMAQKMVDTRPDLNSYSRVSYVRELHGDTVGAIDAMRRAVNAGNPLHEGTLWARVQLGHLYFNSGDLLAAEGEYAAALTTQPDYAYALAGKARVMAARKDLLGAIALYERVSQQLPLPEFLIALGEAYQASNAPAKASQQFELVRTVQQLNASADMNVDLELALFEAEHGVDKASAVRLARNAYNSRPSIYAADALAWALYHAGDIAAAAKVSPEALKLGTRDAALYYRAGKIALANNDQALARAHFAKALAINPHFSLIHAPALEAAGTQP